MDPEVSSGRANHTGAIETDVLRSFRVCSSASAGDQRARRESSTMSDALRRAPLCNDEPHGLLRPAKQAVSGRLKRSPLLRRVRPARRRLPGRRPSSSVSKPDRSRCFTTRSASCRWASRKEPGRIKPVLHSFYRLMASLVRERLSSQRCYAITVGMVREAEFTFHPPWAVTVQGVRWRRRKGRALLRLVVDETQRKVGPAPRNLQKRPSRPKRRHDWRTLLRRLEATARLRAIRSRCLPARSLPGSQTLISNVPCGGAPC